MAHAQGIAVNPHVWGTAVAQAASLQVLAHLPPPHAALFARQPLLEYDQSSHPFRRELTAHPWCLDNNRIAVPDGPGLGIEVRMDTVERFLA